MGDATPQPPARFYTRAIRFPKLIGRLIDGTRIPMGPYRVIQLGAGAVTFLTGMVTRSLWGTGVVLPDVALALAVAVAVTVLSGRLPVFRRSLLGLLLDGYTAVAAAPEGRYRGSLVRLPAPHQVDGQVLFLDVATADEPPIESKPATKSSQPRHPLVRSSIELLLEQARTNERAAS